ncbi:mucin-1-like [Strigops habroptila]|uniref:mucin-1-like n=1 Tax=Strigops habroptila TaxID=2489341 RepID=UPI0011CFD952|nr:mucin-1-like [Strigops habroptila]
MPGPPPHRDCLGYVNACGWAHLGCGSHMGLGKGGVAPHTEPVLALSDLDLAIHPVPSHPTGSEGGAGRRRRQHPGSLPPVPGQLCPALPTPGGITPYPHRPGTFVAVLASGAGHATGPRGAGAPRAASTRTAHPSPGTGHGHPPAALKVTGTGCLPRCLRGHPSVISLARSEFDGSQPSPSPGPPPAPGLAGLPRWGYHGKAAAAAQGERGLPGAPASGRAARRDFSVVSSSAARPEGEVPAPRTGQRPPLESRGAGALLAPHPSLRPRGPPRHAQARRARATCAPRVHSTSWQSRAATASGSAPRRCHPGPGPVVSEGPQNPPLTSPHPHCHLPVPIHSLCTPVLSEGTPAPTPHTLPCPTASPSPRARFKFLSQTPPLAPSTGITTAASSCQQLPCASAKGPEPGPHVPAWLWWGKLRHIETHPTPNLAPSSPNWQKPPWVKGGHGPRRRLCTGVGRGRRVNTAPRLGQTAGWGGQAQQCCVRGAESTSAWRVPLRHRARWVPLWWSLTNGQQPGTQHRCQRARPSRSLARRRVPGHGDTHPPLPPLPALAQWGGFLSCLPSAPVLSLPGAHGDEAKLFAAPGRAVGWRQHRVSTRGTAAGGQHRSRRRSAGVTGFPQPRPEGPGRPHAWPPSTPRATCPPAPARSSGGERAVLRTPPAASRPHATHRNRAAIKRSPHRQRYRSVVVRAAPAAPPRHTPPGRAGATRGPPRDRGALRGGVWEELSQSRGTAAITGPDPGAGGGAAPAPPAPRPVPGAEPRGRPAPLRSAPRAREAGNRARESRAPGTGQGVCV